MPLRTGRRNWLWAVTGVILLAAAALVVLVLVFGGEEEVITYETIAGVPCQSGEHLDFHGHARVDITLEGEDFPVPDNTGIRFQPQPSTAPGEPTQKPEFRCLFWLHTHTGPLVHIEAPEPREYTLGQFFAVWGQPLSETELLDRVAGDGKAVKAFVDGEPWEGDPADIPLVDRAVISLQYGPPFIDLPTELIN
jgi:hypothetical protein